MKLKRIETIATKCINLILVAAFVIGVFPCGVYANEMDSDLKDQTILYYADYATKEEALAAGNEVNSQIIGEGITMLKNDDALPLSTSNKISVFGKRSVSMIYGGQGSGKGGGGATMTIRESLELAGFEVNPELTNFYNSESRSGSGGGLLKQYSINAGLATGETPISMYDNKVKDSYADYNDAAIVVISRCGGESIDLPKSMSTGFNSDGSLKEEAVSGARSYTDHYLQLDQNEADLIKHVGDNFDNVIIVFNTGSQFEVGFLDDVNHYAYHPNVKAALWIGFPGTGTGFKAFGQIIAGEINPSGRTVDTYARDFTKDPTWFNLLTHNNKEHFYSNTSKYAFINYSEGIYSGYRYYETRGFTEGESAYTDDTIKDTTTQKWDSWYNAHVVYPFGYGLSYTTFEWEFVSSNLADGATLSKDGTIEIEVKVTNTGSVAGKDVVQLYYTAPYSAGEIEKSYVALGGFEKTRLIQPGASDTVKVTMNVRDMASYDYNDSNDNSFKGYELDGGEYVIRIMRNAHDEVFSKTYNISSSGYQYPTDNVTGNEVVNRFDDVSNHITTYLSRNDWEGTFPTKPTAAQRVASPEILAAAAVQDAKQDDPSDPWYTEEEIHQNTSGTDGGNIQFGDLIGVDKDDPLWDKFLDQFTVGDRITGLAGLVQNVEWYIPAFEGMGIPTIDMHDGPSGLNDVSGGYNKGHAGQYTLFANEVCLASTWNKNLARQKGLIAGNQAIFGGQGYNGSQVLRISGWFAPAINIHRSPFSGRNFEYFSEDAVLTGKMASEIIRACNEKGLVTFLKHFGVNDQETARDKLHTWASEQSMREIYLKPFEICVKEGKTKAIMTALNSIGAVWTGGSYELQTEILRNEWGFDGVVLTDYIQTRPQLNFDQSIRTGGDLILSNANKATNQINDLDSKVTVACLRRAAKNALYVLVNSIAVNTGYKVIMEGFESQQLPLAYINTKYNADVCKTITINDGGSLEDVKYELAESSTLPEGLSLSTDGTIMGTPTKRVSNHKFTVLAKYKTATKSAEYSISVANDTTIIYDYDGQLPTCQTGVAYTANIATARPSRETDNPTIKYRLSEDSLLPAGLALSEDGVISGTPESYCANYKFSVQAYADGYTSGTKEFTINIVEESSAEFAAKTLALAVYGKNYTDSVATVNESDVTYVLKDSSSLPKGLTLTASGNIVGKPTEVVKDQYFTVLAALAGGSVKEQTFKISVGVAYTGVMLEEAATGEEFIAYINHAQGSGAIKYTIKEGSSLPDGITLSEDGVLSGTPKKAGVYEFIVVVSGDNVVGAEATFQLVVTGSSGSTVIPVIAIISVLAVAAFIFIIKRR